MGTGERTVLQLLRKTILLLQCCCPLLGKTTWASPRYLHGSKCCHGLADSGLGVVYAKSCKLNNCDSQTKSSGWAFEITPSICEVAGVNAQQDPPCCCWNVTSATQLMAGVTKGYLEPMYSPLNATTETMQNYGLRHVIILIRTLTRPRFLNWAPCRTLASFMAISCAAEY